MPRSHASRARAAALGPGEHQLTFQDFIGRLDQLARRAEHPDPSNPAKALFWVVIAMTALGFLVQASHAATIQSHAGYHSELVSQALFRVAGLMALLVGFHFGPRGMQRFLPILMVAAGLLLVAVFVPGIGRSVNGAHRWVDLGGLRFQPSELARIVLVMWVADRCMRLAASCRCSRSRSCSSRSSWSRPISAARCCC
jgi:cell division protein FtsW (lipid II flippase)